MRFSLAGSETNLKDSYVPITSYDLFRNGLPYPGGVYDAHLGSTDHSYKCQTCYNNKKNCLGHDGHLHLNYPVQQPISLNDMRKWLKLICFKCGHPVIEDSQFMKFPKSRRLDEASKLARTMNRKCVHCKQEVHPIIKKDPQEPLALIAEFYEDKKQTNKYTLYPHMIKQILERISDETVLKMGKCIDSHPRNFVITDIKVPSTVIRPDVKKMGGGRSTNDDLTTMLQYIIKKHETIPPVLPNEIDQKLAKAIYELNSAYYDFIKGGGANGGRIKSGSNPLNSLALRLRGKQGRFRKTQMGKRVRMMCRSTITGDPTLKINEVGVPLVFARTIQIKEVVQEFNKKRLMICFNNGRKKYPGCSKVIKKATGAEYGVDGMKDIELENGDIIYRDVITGDVANFNRQPSLKPANISTMRVVVTEDPNILTLRMNVIACPLFDADFDGDFRVWFLILC